MCLILEIAMLIGGIWALVAGRVPSFLVGGGRYRVEGLAARALGVLLMLPLPIAFLGGLVLVFLFGDLGMEYASWLEIAAVVGVGLLAVILVRLIGKPAEYVNDTEASIAKKAQGALVYAVMSATGVGAIVCAPLAFVYAGQALRMIEEFKVGEKHRVRAIAARVIGGMITLLWVVVVAYILFAALAD